MNKAFIREPDAPDPRCPPPRGCGSLGIPVPVAAVQAQVSAEAAGGLADAVYYCASASCPVGYFDTWGGTVPAAQLRAKVYPKYPGAVVCSCLDVGAEQICQEAERGERTLVRRILAAARAPGAACMHRSPTGGSCEEEVRRLFLRYYRKGE